MITTPQEYLRIAPGSLLLLTLLLIHPLHAQVKQGTKKGDLESNLSLLQLWDEPADPIQDFYRIGYTRLAASPDTTYADLAADVAFQQFCRQHAITHLGGPMLGAVTPSSARVWLRTVRPASVEVQISVEGKQQTFGPVRSTRESDLTAVIHVTGLQPRTRHPYRILIDGNQVQIPEHAAITTAPENSRTGQVRIAFGSCFHRWGLGNRAQADLIRSRKPASLLLLGDIAVQDRNNHLGLHRADYLLRDSFTAWHNLVATIPVFATWDDHDYFDNDKAGIPKGYKLEDKIGVREVFRNSWNNPSYGFEDERRGIFLRTRIGPCDIIMVDNRYFREGREGSFLGADQLRWLESQLLDCQGPFIIMSCGTMWSDYVSKGKDSWGRWDPEGRERIFQLIEKHRIGGVLLISGDRHGARGFRIPRPSGFEFYEFEAGSLGGRKGPPVKNKDWDTQLYGISGQYAFGEFSIDATIPDPEVTFRLIRDDGQVLHSLKLSRSQLTPR